MRHLTPDEQRMLHRALRRSSTLMYPITEDSMNDHDKQKAQFRDALQLVEGEFINVGMHTLLMAEVYRKRADELRAEEARGNVDS